MYDFYCDYEEKHTKHNMLCQHYHEAYEILLMADGVKYVFFNDGMYRLEAGVLVILKPYKLHYSESRESNYYKRYVMNFTDTMLKNILSDDECNSLLKGLHSGVIHLNEYELRAATERFEDILALKERKDTIAKKLLSANIAVLIEKLKCFLKNTTDCEKIDIACSHNMAEVLNYINSHFNEDISLEFITNYAHMSKSNFCRIFKEETGTTFLQHLNNLRVAHAHSLLVTTNKSMQKIAEETGFSSLLHFERVFKNIHGTAPSVVRKNYKKL